MPVRLRLSCPATGPGHRRSPASARGSRRWCRRGRVGQVLARTGVEQPAGGVDGGVGPCRRSSTAPRSVVPPPSLPEPGDHRAVPERLAGDGVQGSRRARRGAALVAGVAGRRDLPGLPVWEHDKPPAALHARAEPPGASETGRNPARRPLTAQTFRSWFGLVAEAAIACPCRVGLGTWTRQVITSFFVGSTSGGTPCPARNRAATHGGAVCGPCGRLQCIRSGAG